jgi:cold shock CspA family protein
MTKVVGYVKKVSARGRFFFVSPDSNPEKECFAHMRNTLAGKLPKSGEIVKFEIVPVNDDKLNDRAVNVEVI